MLVKLFSKCSVGNVLKWVKIGRFDKRHWGLVEHAKFELPGLLSVPSCLFISCPLQIEKDEGMLICIEILAYHLVF